MKLDIKSNEHVFVCGMTGTGKSFLTERLTLSFENVVKLDTKNETYERRSNGESPWAGLEEGKDFTVVTQQAELAEVETSKIIYVPDYEEQNRDSLNDFFEWIFRRGNTVLWIDELMSIGTVNSYPDKLKKLMTMGRSKGIGVWCCTQRPSEIPTITLANSRHFFVFDLSLPQDHKRMVEITGMTQLWENPGGVNFWYYKLGDRTTKCYYLTEE